MVGPRGKAAARMIDETSDYTPDEEEEDDGGLDSETEAAEGVGPRFGQEDGQTVRNIGKTFSARKKE